MGTPLVFPVGHYLGSNYPPTGGGLDSHVLRIGWRLQRLERSDWFAVWALAHGLPEGPDMAPWTLAATEGAARASGVRDAHAILEELLDMDLVIDIDPDDDNDAIEFAHDFRLRALQNGIGDLTDQAQPGRFGIGASANNPTMRVDAFTYEMWKWGPACDNLWHLCEVFARAESAQQRASGGDDPRGLLRRCMPALQVLIAHGAAYLDEARVVDPAEDDPSDAEPAGAISLADTGTTAD